MDKEEQKTEQPQETPDYKEVHESSMRDLATETPEEKKEETPKEEVKEAPKEEVKEAPKEDPQEAARKILEEAKQEEEAKKTKEAEEKQAKEQLSDEEKEYEKWAEKFQKDNSRPPTFLEAMKFVGEQVEKNIERKKLEAEKTQKEEQERVQKAQQEERERINKFVDDEMAELYGNGKLTTIKDKTNPSDQGIVERREFFKQWMEVNQKRVSEGKPEIISATRFFYNHYKKPSNQPPGGDAPIAGSQGSSVPPAGAEEIDYKEIHSRPWSFFRKR